VLEVLLQLGCASSLAEDLLVRAHEEESMCVGHDGIVDLLVLEVDGGVLDVVNLLDEHVFLQDALEHQLFEGLEGPDHLCHCLLEYFFRWQ